MKEDFENVKKQVDIEKVATYLLGEPIKGMYRFPGERTPSIKVYHGSQSFFDFGRGVGGDIVRLWVHIRGCNAWEALQEISAVFGLSTDLSGIDRGDVAERIKIQEQKRKEDERAKKRKMKIWRSKVDGLKAQIQIYDDLLASPHIPPLSGLWGVIIKSKQLAEYYLDYLCGTEG